MGFTTYPLLFKEVNEIYSPSQIISMVGNSMLAIIGGTGIYQLDTLETLDSVEVSTPFGPPSAPIIKARYKDNQVLFLPRHGQNHALLPHEINYCANIYALKSLGATQILGISATGSLREDIQPGDFAIPAQYFDFIKGHREKTFFGEGVAAHVSTAEPSCSQLTQHIAKHAQAMSFKVHTGKTYACVDGPRLGTKAESHFLRQIGCDLVGMTNIPEAFLAREAQLSYATLGIVTDFDCWMNDPKHHVTVADVIARYGESLEKAKQLIMAILDTPIAEANCHCRTALKHALLTPTAAIPANKQAMIKTLMV